MFTVGSKPWRGTSTMVESSGVVSGRLSSGPGFGTSRGGSFGTATSVARDP